MIICEGPDGAGKSTLVAHLADKFGLEVGKRGVANRDELYKVTRQDTYTHLAHAVSGQDPVKILDRLFYSEFVYAPVVGRPCEFNAFEAAYVKRVLDAVGCPVIVCLPPYATVARNADQGHQMAGVKEGLKYIYRHYADSARLPWPDNTIWYDYTMDTFDFASLAEVEEEIDGYLKRRKDREAWAVLTGMN